MPTSAVLVHAIRDVTIVNFNQAVIVDDAHVQEIAKQLYALVDAQARKKIILDFSMTKSFSSSALGVLLTLRKKAEDIKGRVVVCGLGKELKRAFKIANLHKLVGLYKNEEKALGAFGLTSAG